MAAERRLRSNWKQSRLLTVALAIAAVVCAFAFWWISGPARSRSTPPLEDVSARAGGTSQTDSESSGRGAARVSDGMSTRVAVTVMTLGNELTAAQIAEFEALNPDIRLVFVEYSSSLLDILIATKDLPDVVRLGPVEHVPLIERGLLLDITPYIANSKVIALDELREQSTAEVAVGARYYGLPQGLATPDFACLYIDTAAFKQAGIPLPSVREPLTYAELGAIAGKLSAKSGRPAFYSFAFERVLTAILAQRGTSMFSDDLSQMTLTGNPQALEVVRFFYDLTVSGAMHAAPATPRIAVLFEYSKLPISQSGYWMGAVITPQTPAYGHVAMLPAPVWDRRLPRRSAYLGGTKLAISAASGHPAQAYRFVEWYVTGKPAQDRAKIGWGFPLLRSMEPLLPKDSEFDRQRLQVALDNLKLPVAHLPAYPYQAVVPAFNQSWVKNIEMARSGKLKFADFASNLQEDVNLAIRDEMTRRNEDKGR